MPRREIEEYMAAEQRLRESVLSRQDYEGKDADLRRIKRKRLEHGETSKRLPTKPSVLEEGGGGFLERRM